MYNLSNFTIMDAPLPFEKIQKYNKITIDKQNYSLLIQIKNQCSIYISIMIENLGKEIIYEGCRLFEDIKKDQSYFYDYSLEEIFDELNELISKDCIELVKNEEQISYIIILPSKKKKTLIFVLLNQNKYKDFNTVFFQQIMIQKDEIIKQKNEIIKQKDEIIMQKDKNLRQKDENLKQNEEIIKMKDEIIKQKDKLINELKNILNKNNEEQKKENNENLIKIEKKPIEKNKNNFYFQNFNIFKLKPKYKLKYHGEKQIKTILHLYDGRLISGGENGFIIIYNKETFQPEIIIKEQTSNINHLIQLKDGNIISCSNDKTMILFQLTDNNKYKILSQVNVGNDNYPHKIRELDNNLIGLVASNFIIFYTNNKNTFIENFNIKINKIGQYRNMIKVKKGELIISGTDDKIQFFELNTKQLKEIIDINRDIHWGIDELLCMMNDKCLCVGGADKITIIDVYQKNIISEVEDKGAHICLFKLNDSILLSGKGDGSITQWKINQNNLSISFKKEKAHESNIRQIITINQFIVTCSDDHSINIW